MEIPFTGKSHNRFWFAVFTPFLLLLLIYFYYSPFTFSTIIATNPLYPPKPNDISHFYGDFNSNATVDSLASNTISNSTVNSPESNNTVNSPTSDINFNSTVGSPRSNVTVDSPRSEPEDSCSGRYIYIHNLPTRFNDDLLKDCRSLLKWTSMCPHIVNMGLGLPLPPSENATSERVFPNTGWFATNQFVLAVIFHNRMKQYKCLTNDSTKASAIFVPFYAGLEAGRNLWAGVNTTVRDSVPLDLVKWLSEKPEWKSMWGRDHFLISGRIAGDVYRMTDNEDDWGNKLMFLPESKNMTLLTIESNCWNNDFAIPYPTYFHPSNDSEVYQWQNKLRTQMQQRRHLFCFAGAPRAYKPESIRGNIMNQCRASSKCDLLECHYGINECDNPFNVIKMFQNSVFCLQPSGDSYTRRSIFDSILSGCIPVFFHPRSAYIQYEWYLPNNHTKYSVLIPEQDVRNGTNIEKILLGISEEEVKAMREEVIRLIPSVIYANPMENRLETIEDAFDIAVRRILERVEGIRKNI